MSNLCTKGAHGISLVAHEILFELKWIEWGSLILNIGTKSLNVYHVEQYFLGR